MSDKVRVYLTHVTSFVLENWIASFIREGQYPSVSIDGTTEVLTDVHHKHRSVLLRKPVWILLRRDTLIGSHRRIAERKIDRDV